MKKEPAPTAYNHNEGDTVIIRNRLYGHRFKIGTVVTIIGRHISDYRCRDNAGNQWWCCDANFMRKKDLELLT